MKRKVRSSEEGFTIIEALVSLTILGVSLFSLTDIFLYNRTIAIKSGMRMEAVAVSQQILDDLRQSDISTFPMSGIKTYNDLPSNPYTATPSLTALSTASSTPTPLHSFSASITYCGQAGFTCNPSSSRYIHLEVQYNGKTIYTVETAYTKFQ